MIASFAHSFIFIKTRKTAGTSIELALSRLCSDEDIVTPLALEEGLRWEHGWRGGQNFTKDPGLMQVYEDIVKQRDSVRMREFARTLRIRGEFYEHIRADALVGKLDAAFWSRAHKWTVERHPYEKAVSHAYFRIWHKNFKSNDFQAVLNRIIARNTIDQRNCYMIDGRLAVDEVIKFEELPVALPRLLAKLGLKLDDEIPRAKARQRLDRRPATEILSRRQKNRIYASCRATFEMLGYER